MPTLSDKRFVLVTGKGGVGKTTFCAALAVSAAAAGKRVLVAMCNTKDQLSGMLGAPPVGPDVSQVEHDVWAVNIQPERALQEYGMLVLHNRALAKTLFDSRYARAFLRAVPGMQEWSMLGKAWWHTTERRPDGSPRFDLVILDAPATGHGIHMLRVPRVIIDVMPPGILRRDAERAWALFQDPVTCGIVLVTLPEELPTTETIELTQALGQMGLPIARVVVNSVLPALFSESDAAALAGISPRAKGEADEVVLALARERAAREASQRENLDRLRQAVRAPIATLPFLFEEAAAPRAIRELARVV